MNINWQEYHNRRWNPYAHTLLLRRAW